MYSVSLSIFSVSSSDALPPYGGEPPSEEHKDTISIKEAEDHTDGSLTFSFERPVGFYYLDIGVIAYLKRGEKMLAQVEHFMPMEKPIEIKSSRCEEKNLIAKWPDIPLEQLGYYGKVSPNKDENT